VKENGFDKSKYTDLFLSESREHLKNMEDTLVRLSGKEDRPGSLNELFRHAHSLKGMSASMGYGAIGEIAHCMEEIFALLKKREIAMNSDLNSLLIGSVEKIHDMLDAIESKGKEPEPAHRHVLVLKDFMQTHEFQISREPGSANLPSRGGSGRVLEIEIGFFRDAPLLSARAVLIFKRLSEKAVILSMTPDLEQIRKGSFQGTLSIRVRTNLDQEILENTIRSVAEVERFKITPCPREQDQSEPSKDETPLPSSVRIRTENLDNFFDNLVELMIQYERLSRLIESSNIGGMLPETAKMDKTIKNLYRELMKVRMLPFSFISRIFERSVRDLAHKLKKKVALKISGGETELDKSMLEELSDPVNHLIRNSIDHGIESPAKRAHLGKSETGTINISLRRKSDSVIITVEDDGSGIDIERVKRIALQENYITEDEYRSLRSDDAYMLVTIPGFSTAKKTTAVSGRGVGLDAVRTKIENLGGRMRIGLRIGGGTVVEFTLPLTVAVISAFIIREKENLYAVPVSSVEKTTAIIPSDIVQEDGRMVTAKSGMVTQVFELGALLGETNPQTKPESPKHLLLFSAGDRMMGLAVDEIIYRKNIVVKPLLFPLDQLREFSGASLLEDGKIALIIDIRNLVKA